MKFKSRGDMRAERLPSTKPAWPKEEEKHLLHALPIPIGERERDGSHFYTNSGGPAGLGFSDA